MKTLMVRFTRTSIARAHYFYSRQHQKVYLTVSITTAIEDREPKPRTSSFSTLPVSTRLCCHLSFMTQQSSNLWPSRQYVNYSTSTSIPVPWSAEYTNPNKCFSPSTPPRHTAPAQNTPLPKTKSSTSVKAMKRSTDSHGIPRKNEIKRSDYYLQTLMETPHRSRHHPRRATPPNRSVPGNHRQAQA